MEKQEFINLYLQRKGVPQRLILNYLFMNLLGKEPYFIALCGYLFGNITRLWHYGFLFQPIACGEN